MAEKGAHGQVGRAAVQMDQPDVVVQVDDVSIVSGVPAGEHVHLHSHASYALREFFQVYVHAPGLALPRSGKGTGVQAYQSQPVYLQFRVTVN